MDERCETCKWWHFNGREDVVPEGYGLCELMTSSIAPAIGRNNDPMPGEVKALAVVDPLDWDAGEAELVTAPDFGCVQYEPREDTGR